MAKESIPIKIMTSPETDVECRITCPCCLGTKTTPDFKGTYSCPWCFAKGSVPPNVYDVYWSVRGSVAYTPRQTFGARTTEEAGNSKPRELEHYKQIFYPDPTLKNT